MKTKYLYIFLLLIMSTAISFSQQRIIGGTAADITERPYQAAVFIKGEFKGGGVIIGNRWILTAAHVVNGISASDIQVSTGYTNLNDDKDRWAIKNVIIHELYKLNDDEDVALLELNAPLYLGSDKRKAISLAVSKSYAQGTKATVSGWGSRVVGVEIPSNLLYKANVTIKGNSGSRIIAEPSSNVHYSGDSGGPLTIESDGKEILIGIVKSGSKNAPTAHESYFMNIGYFHDWIIKHADIYTDAIDGPDLVCETGVFTISPIPLNGEIQYSPNIECVSESDGEVVIRAKSRGRAFITIDVNNSQVSHKYFWAKEPAITSVTSNGSYLTAETAGLDAGITYSEWRVAGNKFTSSSATLSCPYSSGTYSVSVTARNDCGTSVTYNGQVTISNNKMRYEVSVLSGTKQVKVSLAKENAENIYRRDASWSVPTNLDYQLVNATSGVIAANGSISSQGGILDFGHVASGIYILRLDVGNGAEETFKFMLK